LTGHVANIVLNYRVNNWLELGARWTYATNFPITPPIGITQGLSAIIAVNPLNRSVIFNLDYGDKSNRLAAATSLPRLDFRATAIQISVNRWAFYIDVINVYNRKNVKWHMIIGLMK
jgi:hypothetical protein